MMRIPRQSPLCGLATTLIAILLAGCARVPEPVFVSADETSELPELHQENIKTNLRTMFGTPKRPRFLLTLPVEIAESDAEADADEDEDEPDTDEVESRLTVIDPTRLAHGAAVYDKRCAGCHGVSGDGMGPAANYLQPRPRDYRKGIFKFTSTPYGMRPTRQDLVRTIRRGAKGTSMPAFPWMSDLDINAVVDYVIYLSIRGRVEGEIIYLADDYDEDEAIEGVDFEDSLADEIQEWETANQSAVKPISAEPPADLASVQAGRRLFIESSCYSCHGGDAKGQTEWLSPEFLAAQASADSSNQVQINHDAWGEPAPAANITAGMLHGGRRPLDIYRRIYTGINGTPMPQFGPTFAENPDAIWHMVHYVAHIVDGGDPEVGITVADVQAEKQADAETQADATDDATTEASEPSDAEATEPSDAEDSPSSEAAAAESKEPELVGETSEND